MSDSVTLYRVETKDPNGIVTRTEPVGEFVSRPWCKTHKSDEFAPEEDTMLVCLQSVYDYEVGSDDGLPCEFVERLVKVIPDDPKEIKHER